MKKSIVILFIMMQVFFLYANDTYFMLSGGSLLPSESETTDIQMKEELIKINLKDDYYEVCVDFKFYNYGESKVLTIGFPFFGNGYSGSGKIYDFKCWTNGIEESFENKPISIEWKKTTDLENAYIRNIEFKKNKTTETRVYYKCEYGAASPSYKIASYLYGTGKPWKNAIGKITLQIENNNTYNSVKSVQMGKNYITPKDFKRLSERLYEFKTNNVEPEDFNEVFEIEIGSCIQDEGPKAFPAYFIYTSRFATKEDIFWLSKSQLRLVRNMIYALHGYEFKSEDLKHFVELDGKYWYPPYKINPDFSEDDFSEVEKSNIKFLLKKENKL